MYSKCICRYVRHMTCHVCSTLPKFFDPQGPEMVNACYFSPINVCIKTGWWFQSPWRSQSVRLIQRWSIRHEPTSRWQFLMLQQ